MHQQDSAQKKEKLESELKRSENMLSNPSFINKAPKEKVDQEKKKQEEYRLQYNDVLKALKEIEG